MGHNANKLHTMISFNSDIISSMRWISNVGYSLHHDIGDISHQSYIAKSSLTTGKTFATIIGTIYYIGGFRFYGDGSVDLQ